MICRLMLNLRHTAEEPPHTIVPTIVSIRVTAQHGLSHYYIGDLGEDLDIDSYERREARFSTGIKQVDSSFSEEVELGRLKPHRSSYRAHPS